MTGPEAGPLTLVVGATGRTGRETVHALRRRGLPVRALVRNAAAKEIFPVGTDIVEGRLQSQTALEAAIDGAELIVFTAAAIGSADSHPSEVDFEGVARAAAYGRTAGVKRFILLSSAAVTQPEHPHNATFKNVLRFKAKGEESLRRSGLAYTIVRALGLRDRPGGLCGIRILQGDRIAFGEDIARIDLANFLADLAQAASDTRPTVEVPTGFSPSFEARSLCSATVEVFNDGRLTPGRWVSNALRLDPDRHHG